MRTINVNILTIAVNQAVDRVLHYIYVNYNRLDMKLSQMITPVRVAPYY